MLRFFLARVAMAVPTLFSSSSPLHFFSCVSRPAGRSIPRGHSIRKSPKIYAASTSSTCLSLNNFGSICKVSPMAISGRACIGAILP